MEILIAILGLIIAWLTYKKTFHSNLKEEREHLIVVFRATQTLSTKLKENLETLANRNNLHNENLLPNITYKEYIQQLEMSQQKFLSDELLNKVMNEKLTKSIIQSMTQSIEQQFNSLQSINTEAEFRLNK